MAAPTYDATSGSSTGVAASLTFSHTCGGSNRVLFVGVSIDPGASVSGVTYNGISMARVGTVQSNSDNKLDVYYLVAPASGANNVVISISGTSGIIGFSLSYKDADQTTPYSAVSTASITSGKTISGSVASETDKLIADFVSWGYSNGGSTLNRSVGTGQTKRQDTQVTVTGDERAVGGCSTKAGAASSTSMSWSLASTPSDWVNCLMKIIAVQGITGASAARTSVVA